MQGRGTIGKTAVIGAKDRATNHITARVIARTDATTQDQMIALAVGLIGKRLLYRDLIAPNGLALGARS